MTTPASLRDLLPDPDNPREIDDASRRGLGASMEAFEDIAGIVFNERTGHLVGGHQRVALLVEQHGDLPLRALTVVDEGSGEELAIQALVTPDGAVWPVRVVDWDEDKGRAANLTANSPHIAGTYTPDAGKMLRQVQASLPDLFGKLRLDVLQADLAPKGRSTGKDVTPPVPAEPVSKLGEVYQLGPHRVVCGDCTDEAVVALALDGQEADLVVTDPPYGVSYADKQAYLNASDGGSRNETPIADDHGTLADTETLWRAAFARMFDATKPGGCYYMTGPQGGDLSLAMMMMMQEAGWLLKHMLIWAKNHLVLGRSDYHYKHEPILYGWKPGAAHCFGGPSNETSVWEIDRPHRSEDHPTMKPVELFARAIRNGSRPGETVLDLFLGSGTAVIAAAQEGRVCYGCEIDPAYVDVIRRRWTTWARSVGVAVGPGGFE